MKRRLEIRGPLVHDVGYRAFLLDNAEDLGFVGFAARNIIANGTQGILVLLEGPGERVEEFERLVKAERPYKADVSGISFEDYSGDVERIEVFAGRFQSRQLRKGISSILQIEAVQKQMLGKQDQMLGKQDQMLGKQDQILAKLDETRVDIVDKLDETKCEIVGKLDEAKVEIAGKMDETLGDRLSRLECDMAQVKAKLGI